LAATSPLQTPLCRQLGIDYPIFSVGFGASAIPELAAAVSNAGACGVLGWGGMPPEAVKATAERTRSLTKRPFGFNFIIAGLDDPDTSDEDRAFVHRCISGAIDGGAALLVFFWGDPAPFVADAHARGVKVFLQVGSAGEAAAAALGGTDGVIAQGVEAGGHVRATESLWKVLPECVKAVEPLPVLAAGGIGDGAAIVRALRRGAQGVSMGTRFLASEEAWAHRSYKERVVASSAGDTVLADIFNADWADAPHRVLRNRIVRDWERRGWTDRGTTIGRMRMPWGKVRDWERYSASMVMPDFDGDIEDVPMWAGTSVDAVNDIKPAAAIVRDLVQEAEVALKGTHI
jgi:NAD(P)H-dependent flavin oxidoreductase YrpB (nitropropane dioxygenase family)